MKRVFWGYFPKSEGVAFALVGLLALGSVGCAGKPLKDPVAPVQTSNGPARTLSDEDFAKEAHRLLLSTDRSESSKLELAGVVQYQLSRAERLFREGHLSEAEDVATGALLLLRHDDELLSATRGQGFALMQTAHAAAKMGDAGRAGALYELALAVIEDPTIRADIEAHLAALSEWNQNTQGPTALEQIGEQTRRSLARAIVDPRAEAYLDAREGIILWMRAALGSSAGEQSPRNRAERELALEAYRAIRSGAPAMVALNLRQGTPGAAVVALEKADLDRALPPGLQSLIEDAERQNDPKAWLELFRQVEQLRESAGSETELPRYVPDAASLWTALGLYRSSPGELEHAMPLAMTLVEFGMPEVASTLLAQNTTKATSADAVAWSLSLILRGLLELSHTDQLGAARRSYAEAIPLFRIADGGKASGPSSARAQSLMAALEARHGHAARSLALMELSVIHLGHPESLLRLAQLQAQQGKPKDARKSIQTAIERAQASGNLLLESRAEEALFRWHRDAGEESAAGEALGRALSRILVLRQMEVSTAETAPVERQLARLLEYYGRTREMNDAYLRALEASRNNPMELEITLTDMSRAALTTSDLGLGRRATQSALDFGLPPENSIYIALWQQLLEKKAGALSDGMSQEVLTRAGKAEGWLNTLRKFGLGEVKASDLKAAARGIPEEVEADFYLALSESKADLLSGVAQSPAVDLIEVRIAQDLLAKKKQYTLPDHVKLP